MTNVPQDHYTTLEAGRLLGLAVRSVQLMVDRGELEAWKTAGGHRRISRASVEAWAARKTQVGANAASKLRPGRKLDAAARPQRILLIEDSIHFQNLISLLVAQQFAEAELHVAGDGISGLALYGQLQPDVLIVDILLPGIDGPTLISTLRSHPQFAQSRLIVVTSLDAQQREPFAFALKGVDVVHKPDLVAQLPGLLAKGLAQCRQGATGEE